MNWLGRRHSTLFPLVLLLAALGITTTVGPSCGGAEGEWVRLKAAPTFAGLDAVPEGWAVRVVKPVSKESEMRSLIVPETGDFGVENTMSGHASLSTLDVVVGGVHYGFGPGDGVRESSAAGTRPNLDDAYGAMQSGLIPADAAWFKRGDSFRTTFKFTSGEAGTPSASTEVTYEVEQDPATGILLREQLKSEADSSETRRELVRLADAKVPTANTIYEYAAQSWRAAVGALRQLSFDAVGLNLPGAVPTRIMVLSLEPGSEHVELYYAVGGGSQRAGTVVQVESLAYGPESTDLLSDKGGGAPTDVQGGFFRRGDAVVRITLTAGGTVESPSGEGQAGHGLSMETLVAALVPIAELGDAHFRLPASYTPAGTTRLDGSGVAR